MAMAASLEFGKLVATSYLYRYWTITSVMLKAYLVSAVIILMAITSMGVFGYLSAAYQANSSKFTVIDSRISLITQEKQSFDKEIDQINSRISTLNQSRSSQEQRLAGLPTKAAQLIYKDIEKSNEEIQRLNDRVVLLQQSKAEKSTEIISLQSEIFKSNDIGTFKFVANAIDKPLDSVVTGFICVLISVFDPLAVALVLAFNVATKKPTESILVEEEEQISLPVDGIRDYELYRQSKKKNSKKVDMFF